MKTIPLFPGGTALVDDEDFPTVAGYEWRRAPNGRVVRLDAAGRWRSPIETALGYPRNKRISHRNNNLADCRRANLHAVRRPPAWAPRKIWPRATFAEWFFRTRLSGTNDPDGCWEYQRARSQDGYGRITFEGTVMPAHVVAHLLWIGTLTGTMVLHSCDNPPCCNPKHLRSGDGHANMADMVAKGRHVGILHPDRAARGDRAGSRVHPDRREPITIDAPLSRFLRHLDARRIMNNTAISVVLGRSTWTVRAAIARAA